MYGRKAGRGGWKGKKVRRVGRPATRADCYTASGVSLLTPSVNGSSKRLMWPSLLILLPLPLVKLLYPRYSLLSLAGLNRNSKYSNGLEVGSSRMGTLV